MKLDQLASPEIFPLNTQSPHPSPANGPTENAHGQMPADATVKAFKRAPSVEMSTWYKGILISNLATIPPDDGITYATVDLGETIKVFAKYGVRFLAPDEIAIELPAFPLCPRELRTK